MAHFAKVVDTKVVEVIVVANQVLDADGDFPDAEESGQAFIASLGLDGEWLQTSYSGGFRGNYAGIGFTYDENLDAFIPPKPTPDATLDESTFSWVVPAPAPEV
jgi:hypothetical protein